MTTTTDFTVPHEDGWLLVASGSESVTIALVSAGAVQIAIGEDEPDDERGPVLSEGGSFAAGTLAETDKVFVRATQPGSSEQVSVIAS